MGVLGCPEFFTWHYSFDENEYYFTSICVSCLYHGIDWIYSVAETIYSYDYKVWYFLFFNSSYDDSFDYFFNVYWYISLNASAFQLFWSVILDSYVFNRLFVLPYTDEWFRSMLASKEISLVFIYHPELSFCYKDLNNYYLSTYFTNPLISLYEWSNAESYATPIILFPQLILLIFIAFIFSSFFFSYFTHSSKEGIMIDADYLVSNSSVEAEKEISSYDDMILGVVVLFYVFGWYFFINCWSLISIMPELILVFYLFPGLYLIIVGIPTFLVYDFGVFFLAYLKGIGATPVFFFELMYDYIAIIIFYTRILVQGVRLILMLFTYASMHDMVMYFSYYQKMAFADESFWEEISSISLTLDSVSYFFLMTLPTRIVYWIYEILHTFFVITVQFAAFFAIVFWLFLFLYTFFTMEKYEDYLNEKRLKMRNKYKDIYTLKKVK